MYTCIRNVYIIATSIAISIFSEQEQWKVRDRRVLLWWWFEEQKYNWGKSHDTTKTISTGKIDAV